MEALLRRDKVSYWFWVLVGIMGGLSRGREFELEVGLHDGKNNVCFVFNGGESYRCDHYDHEVECPDLLLAWIDTRIRPEGYIKYIPNWQTSTTRLRVPEYARVQSQQDIAKSYRAIRLQKKY